LPGETLLLQEQRLAKRRREIFLVSFCCDTFFYCLFWLSMKCFNCNKVISKAIKIEPSYHFTSPGSINRFEKNKSKFYYECFCSFKCRKETEKKKYAFFAGLDRNASDSECFIHNHWERDSMYRNIRVGKCKITGKEVRVEPQQPGNNSGQPIECYEHFKLRESLKI